MKTLDKKIEKIKEITLDSREDVKVYDVSENGSGRFGISKVKENDYKNMGWIDSDQNLILYRKEKYHSFFKDLKEKYEKEFPNEKPWTLKYWPGFNMN